MTAKSLSHNDDNSWKRISYWRYNHLADWRAIGSDGRVIQHQEQRIEDRSSADFCEEETIQVEQTKTYTIVGVSTNPGYQKFAEPCYLVLTTGVQTTISDIYLKNEKH